MAFDPDAYLAKKSATTGFDPDAYLAKRSSSEDPSELGSAARSAVAGAAFGLDDEFIGGLDAAGRAVGITNLGSAKHLNELGLASPTLDSETLKQAYNAGRDSTRKTQDIDEEVNPASSMIGGLGGSLATGGVFSGGKTLAARAGKSALGGALSGFGTSEADTIGGLAADTGTGAAFGSAFQVGGEKLLSPAMKAVGNFGSKVIDKGTDALDWTLKKAGRIGANVPEDVTERYLQRSAQVNASMPREELVESILDPDAGVMKQLQQKLSAKDGEAWDVLSPNLSLDSRAIRDVANEHLESILGGKNGTLSRNAGIGASADKVKAVDTFIDQLMEAYEGGRMNEGDVKSIIQDLQQKAFTDAGSPRSSIAAEALRSLSGKLNSSLKGMNPQYAERMIPVEKMTKALKSAENLFVNQSNPSASAEKATRAIDRFRNPKNQFARDTVENLDQLTGSGIKDNVLDTLAAEAFEKGDTNGSRKTLLGAVAGKAIGSTIGAVGGYAVGEEGGASVGAFAGFGADRYAGKVFKTFLDGRLKGPEAAQFLSQKLGKFAAPLIEAANRGNHAVSATHFIMMSRDPGYREALKAMEGDEDGKR